MTKKITIDRAVVEQVLEALEEADLLMEHRQNIELRRSALVALHAALERTQCAQGLEPSLAGAIRAEPTELIHKWRVLELIKDHTHLQPKLEPLTPEAVSDLWIKHARSGAYIHAFAQAIERAHGIGGDA